MSLVPPWRAALLACCLLASSLYARPAEAKVVVITGLSASHSAPVGGVVQGAITVRNDGEAPWTGTVSLSDYHTDVERSYFPPPGTVARSSAGWMTVEPTTLTLAPAERAVIRYELRVPDDPSLRGSYWNNVVIRDLDTSDMQASASSDPRFTLKAQYETAVRISTDVGAEAPAEVKFHTVALHGEADAPKLQIDLENTGERWMKATAQVELYGEDGARLGPFVAGPKSLYPGSEVRLDVALAPLASGDYVAVIIADGGDVGAFGTRKHLRVP